MYTIWKNVSEKCCYERDIELMKIIKRHEEERFQSGNVSNWNKFPIKSLKDFIISDCFQTLLSSFEKHLSMFYLAKSAEFKL